MVDDFQTPAGLTFLDTAGYGLPPKGCLRALRQALAGWSDGTASWQEEWEPAADRCRELFAILIHGAAAEVSLLPAVSLATAIVASGVPPVREVLIEKGEFRSVLYPLLVAEQKGRLHVREVAIGSLAEEVRPQTALVALSHVQSADGRVADLAEIVGAASDVGALVYLDATHSAGTIPLNVETLGVDFLSCAAYKWLCCPRGVAFLWSRRERQAELIPIAAGWRASATHRVGGYYGGPLELAGDGARFDISVAWHAWVGAAESLAAITAIDENERFAFGHDLACDLARRLGLPEPRSTILSVPIRSSAAAQPALEEAGLKVTLQQERIRVSPHFYNIEADVEHAADVLSPLVSQ